MNKIALCAKTLVIAISAAMMVSCNNKQAENVQEATPEQKASAASLNIRYIDADSIAMHYNLAKDFREAQMRQVSKIDQAQRSRGQEIQKLANSIQQKVNNNGYLSQESFNADQETLNKKQTEAQNYLNSLEREAQQEMMQQQIQLTDSIEAFIRDYNKSHGYDAILYKAAGVYFNPALDITDEVIKGLNARYNKVAE